jgi:hypothetical protein
MTTYRILKALAIMARRMQYAADAIGTMMFDAVGSLRRQAKAAGAAAIAADAEREFDRLNRARLAFLVAQDKFWQGSNERAAKADIIAKEVY